MIISLISPNIALMSYSYSLPEENYEIRLLSQNLLLAFESCLAPTDSDYGLYHMKLSNIDSDPPPGPYEYRSENKDQV